MAGLYMARYNQKGLCLWLAASPVVRDWWPAGMLNTPGGVFPPFHDYHGLLLQEHPVFWWIWDIWGWFHMISISWESLQCLLRLVLTDDGTLYSRGVAMYGSTGHGGARDVGDTRCGGGTSTMVLGQKKQCPCFWYQHHRFCSCTQQLKLTIWCNLHVFGTWHVPFFLRSSGQTSFPWSISSTNAWFNEHFQCPPKMDDNEYQQANKISEKDGAYRKRIQKKLNI